MEISKQNVVAVAVIGVLFTVMVNQVFAQNYTILQNEPMNQSLSEEQQIQDILSNVLPEVTNDRAFSCSGILGQTNVTCMEVPNVNISSFTKYLENK